MSNDSFTSHDNYKELVKFMQEDGEPHTTMLLVSATKTAVNTNVGTSCTANMTSITYRKADAFGCVVSGYNQPGAQDFLEWYFGPRSVFRSMIHYLGDNFHIIRKKNGHIVGFLCTTNKINVYVMNAFLKGTRTCYEHRASVLPFWVKYTGLGYDPSLVFFLAHFFNVKGQHTGISHGFILSAGGWRTRKIAAGRFFNPDHDEWDMKYKPMSTSTSYSGVDDYILGDSNLPMIVMSRLPRVKKGVKMKTFFIDKYEKLKEQSKDYTHEDLCNFLENFEEVAKEMQ